MTEKRKVEDPYKIGAILMGAGTATAFGLLGLAAAILRGHAKPPHGRKP